MAGMKSRLISFILLVYFSKLIGGELVKNSASQNGTFLDSFEPVAFRSLFSRRPQQFLRRISDSSSENLLVQMPLGLNCTADDNGAKGYCVDLGQTASRCYDRDVVDSADCDPATHVCCTERRAITVDDVPCGLLGLSIRSPRRPRLPNDPMVNEVCWMASLMGILKSNGMNQHVCDAVIFNSTHVMTPAECLLRVKKDLAKYKRVLAMVGKPVHVFRQSLDFSQPRCGQEYAVLIGGEVFRADGAMLGRITKKGYVFLQVDGNILKDRCTCRVCLPTYGDLAGLTTSSRCYASGFVPTDSGERKKGVKDRSSALLTLDTFRTNLVSPSACRILLAPQKLQEEQTEKIISTLLCSVAPTLGYGRCLGVMGDGLTCVGEHGHHFLVGLSIQPQDCYSAPRLFRNVIGCHDGIDDPDMACPLPQLTPPGFGTCGSPGSNHTDPFGLAFQTSMGKAQRALNVGRRMQMVSSFPVSDAALMGRSAFAESQISNPGLHFQYDALAICWEVAVVDPSRGHCSGALISSRHVLTAAHCLTELV
ncbi:hypothetical protein RvY_03820-2 [Ramazzottius varieornatus]|uniref:Peptidase S1 domain-containing protein n=1 Tax=Ramazzottius varieornatus TaxID=947166 RepID=A0A1D1UPF4_RAMVA|nr:hypothetical protein RvY_03820-2 [Ramazzottius varieornatus]